ncbi:MFS transporter, MHS family, proline/betaine transporter [Brevibacterium sp. 239c]|uniref:MFS transporter n=1 Tax=Brevibacterium sp. 239c TaxID=1965356 RepID=UPI000C3CE365|nr:MFS transporter [Brevibacterium sp. 239c]SMY04419.1 MFS transporter, MHS family, proline/betaine transporter [Brevibacterium sp. 239c]
MTMSNKATGVHNSHPSLRRTILGASVGNFVEWYEFAVYGVLAAYISLAMFPTDDPATAMLNTWAAFGIAFLVRPIGGVILARLGDRVGRRQILFVTISMMSIATFAMSLIPSYSVIGIAAPVLLICVRIAQGIAAGGEFSGAAAYLYEHAPAGRRARTISWLGVSSFCATVSGSAIATLLTFVLAEDDMQSWGWRLVFATALPLGFIGIYIRRHLMETPEFQKMLDKPTTREPAPQKESLWQVIRENLRSILIYLGFGGFYSIAVYVSFSSYFAYLLANGMSTGSALAINTIAGLVIIVGITVSGGLADRYGRRPILIICTVVLAAVVIPAFLLGAAGSFGQGLLGALIFVIPLSVFITPAIINVAELFPTKVRVTAGAAAYNLTVIVGGFTPYLATWLTQTTGSLLAFPVFVAMVAVIALAVVVFWYRDPDTTEESMPGPDVSD